MTDRQNYVAQLCDQALLRVLSGGFSAAIVENIVDELRKMHSALDPPEKRFERSERRCARCSLRRSFRRAFGLASRRWRLTIC
jgi:ribosomal protein S14